MTHGTAERNRYMDIGLSSEERYLYEWTWEVDIDKRKEVTYGKVQD